MNNQRNKYFDLLRGIAIIMVIGIHSLGHPINPLTITGFFELAIRQILNCAVPLFLAISGFFITQKDISQWHNRKVLWSKQIPKVYIPCLFWSSGWFLLDIMRNGIDNIPLNFIMLACGGFSVYYFIAVIIQLYIIIPCIAEKYRWWKIIAVTTCLSVISISIVSYLLYYESLTFPLIAYAGSGTLWAVFFVIGAYISKHGRDYSIKSGILIMITGLLMSIVESIYFINISGHGLGIKLSSFIFSVGVIIILFSKKIEVAIMSIPLKIIIWIGEISFGIYFIHTYILEGVHKFLNSESWWTVWGITISISILSVIVLKAILPNSFAKKYLGLR